MLALKQYRDKALGLPDLLNIAFLLDGWQTEAGEMAVAMQKDGSLLTGFRYPMFDTAQNFLNNYRKLRHTKSASGTTNLSLWVKWSVF